MRGRYKKTPKFDQPCALDLKGYFCILPFTTVLVQKAIAAPWADWPFVKDGSHGR